MDPLLDAGINPLDLRQALGAFVTGVTVVTTTDQAGCSRGFTANSFTSVSLDPPLVLVCVGRTLTSYPVFEAASAFAINVLSEHQKHVSNIFASRGHDRFGAVPWHGGVLGAPVIDDAAAWFECEVHQRIPAGDHLILIGRVRSYGHAAAEPLGYCRGAYARVRLEQDGITESVRRTRIGVILECNGKLILTVDAGTNRLGILCAASLGSEHAPDTLYGKLARLGIGASLDCLFSVYDDEESHALNVYYRGTASGIPETIGYASIAFDEIPWDRLAGDLVSVMLRRYVDERARSVFSIYAGNRATGNYRKVLDAQPT